MHLFVPKNYYFYFRLSSSISLLCRKWIRQNFFNTGMMFNDIQLYFIFVTLFGPNYSVYFCVSAIQYIMNKEYPSQKRRKIYKLSPEDIMIPLDGFKPNEHLNYMQQLDHYYGKYVGPDIKNGIEKLKNLNLTS